MLALLLILLQSVVRATVQRSTPLYQEAWLVIVPQLVDPRPNSFAKLSNM